MVQAVPFFGLDRLAGGTPGAVIPVLSCGGVSLQSSAYPRGLQSFHADAPGTVPAVPEFLAGYRGTECPRLGRKGRTFKCRPLEADQGL